MKCQSLSNHGIILEKRCENLYNENKEDRK